MKIAFRNPIRCVSDGGRGIFYSTPLASGASLFEFIVTVIIISVLMAVLIPRFQKNVDEAHELSVQVTGQALSSAVNLVHMNWIMMGQPQEVDRIIGFGKNDVASSSKGWPTDARRGADASHKVELGKDKTRCRRIWNALLRGATDKEVGERTLSHWDAYEIEIPRSTVCRYVYVVGGYTGYIDYDLTDGSVEIYAKEGPDEQVFKPQ